MAVGTSVKHLQVDKAKSTMLAVVGVATFVTILCLFATNSMLAKANYQSKVINQKHKVVDQLKDNIKSVSTLMSQYQSFATQTTNVLGGSSSGSGNLDGDNARIILDALPSKYDAPALASSIEKLILGRSATINAIDVKDDPTGNPDDAKSSPATTTMPFSFESLSNYQISQGILNDFEKSIRPFDITNLEISGSDNNLKMVVNGSTYFQPAKTPKLMDYKEVK